MSMYIEVCKVKDYMAMEDLKFHPDNHELRSITTDSLERLKDSIIANGFYEPILVWKKNNFVLSGNQRLKAALELVAEGWIIGTSRRPNRLPVVIEDVEDDRAKEILIGSNNHHGNWIEESLAKALEEVDEPLRLGFSMEDVDKLVQISKEDVDAEIKKAADELDDGTKVGDVVDTGPSEKPPEPMDSLTMPQSAMKDLKGTLGKIAKMLNDDWASRDSYEQATVVLCQAIRESGFLDDIKEALEDA